MSKLVTLLGKCAVKSVRVELLAGKGKVVGIYFCAQGCPSCTKFTSQLAEWYKNVKEGRDGEKFELVYCTSDLKLDHFNDHIKEMRWLALPFAMRHKQVDLYTKLKIGSRPLPILAFVYANNGHVVTTEGCSIIQKNPMGEGLVPWKPVVDMDFIELMSSEVYCSNKVNERTTWSTIVKQYDYVGLLFSAKCSLPCQTFLPLLREFYKNTRSCELIYVTTDFDEEDYQSTLSEMPWWAFGFESRCTQFLYARYNVYVIPSLLIINAKTGRVITRDGREGVYNDVKGENFPWIPQPLLVFKRNIDRIKINRRPMLIVTTDGSAEEIAMAQAALKPVAELYFERHREEDIPEFMYTDDLTMNETLAEALGKKELKPLSMVLIDVPRYYAHIHDSSKFGPNPAEIRDFLDGKRVEENISLNWKYAAEVFQKLYPL